MMLGLAALSLATVAAVPLPTAPQVIALAYVLRVALFVVAGGAIRTQRLRRSCIRTFRLCGFLFCVLAVARRRVAVAVAVAADAAVVVVHHMG